MTAPPAQPASPLGVNGFARGGWGGARPNGPSLDGMHSLAGAAFVRSRWVYFALIVNWPAFAGSLPVVEPSYAKKPPPPARRERGLGVRAVAGGEGDRQPYALICSCSRTAPPVKLFVWMLA